MLNFPATLRALQYRNFQLFFVGQIISLCGTWIQTLAQGWLVYRLTGSLVLLGGIGFVGQIPLFLLSPIAGIVADRYNRQRVVIATQTSSMVLAFVLAALTLTNTVHVWHIFVLSAILGVVNAFDISARQSFIVEMVGKPDLMNAIALNSSMFNATRIAGPAIAGLMIAVLGEGWCFFVNGASYIAVIAGLLLMRVPPLERPPREGSPLKNMIDGFRFVAQSPPIYYLLAVLGVISLAGSPFTVLMPAFADRVLHGGPKALGWLMGSSGAGALWAALILAGRRHLAGLGRWAAIAAASFSLWLIAFAFSHTFWLSVALLMPVGFSLMIQVGATNTLIQSMVPDNLRGRVISIYAMTLLGLAPFGSLAAGFVADRLGAPKAIAIGGAVCLIAALLFWTRLPAFRDEARRMILAQDMGAQNLEAKVAGQ